MVDLYILDNEGLPVPENDVLKWGQWFENHGKERIVKQTNFPEGGMISTVFLGMDHSFGGNTILLYETMVFKNETNWEDVGAYAKQLCAASSDSIGSLTLLISL